MKKIGALLKAEREQKKLSLHEVGMALKINPKILKSIEESDSQNIPAKTFLRGFIRSYAQYLKMDVENIMELFQNEFGSTRPEEPQHANSLANATAEPSAAPKPSQQDTARPKDGTSEKPMPVKDASVDAAATKPQKRTAPPTDDRLTRKNVYTVVGSLILIISIAFVAKMVDKYQKESQRVNLSQPDLSSPNPIALDDKSAASATTDASVALPIKDLEAPPMTPIATPTPAPLQTPAPTPALAATPTPAPIVKATPSPAVKASPAPTVTPTTPTPVASATPTASSSPAPKQAEVIVEALNKVEIRYSFGADKWETLSLLADELHTFKSKTGVQLEINDGGAVNLIVNGRDLGVPGTIGKPIKLSYPK